MKTTINLLICTFVISIYLTSCTKPEEKKQEPQTQVTTPLDQLSSIIACTDPFEKKLYVAEGFEKIVLDALGAAQEEGITYLMDAANTKGDSMKFRFTMVIEKPAMILAFTTAVEEAAERAAAAGKEADKDSARGEFLNMFEKDGIFYRVYKDAECSAVAMMGDTGPCIPQVVLLSGKSFKSGQFVQKKFYPNRTCIKGTNVCLEAMRVIEETRIYDNSNCQDPPLNVYASKYAFTCTK